MENKIEFNSGSEEFNLQRREQLLKGDYARIEIIIENNTENGSNVPYVHQDFNNCSLENIAFLIACMQSNLEQIKNNYPIADFVASKFITVEDIKKKGKE